MRFHHTNEAVLCSAWSGTCAVALGLCVQVDTAVARAAEEGDLPLFGYKDVRFDAMASDLDTCTCVQ